MSKLLKSKHFTATLLNGTLLVLFGCAWASDRWPSLLLPSLVLAAVVVLSEAILLYSLANRARPSPEATELSANEQIQSSLYKNRDREQRDAQVVQDVVGLAEYELTRKKAEEILDLLDYHSRDVVYLRLRASRPVTWPLANVHLEELASPEFRRIGQYVIATRSTLKHLQPFLHAEPSSGGRAIFKAEPARALGRELEKWKLVQHGDDAFNIDAGAFEIEFFHGRTNIRVLDSARVTVEGKNRGVAPEGAPPELVAPKYQ